MTRRTVAAYATGRDNNFNLCRIVAALLVVFSHTFGLTGAGDAEPFRRIFGLSFGSWAVDLFFALSGFLVCKSWDRQPSVARFLLARATRIYPALWVCTLLMVAAVGLPFTSLPWPAFLTHLDTLKFVIANLTLLPKGTFTSLPGVFDGHSVNNSLWTLPYELKMYLGLLALGLAGLLARGRFVALVAGVALVCYARGALGGHHEDTLSEYSRFVFCFFAGVLMYLVRESLPLTGAIAAGLLALLAACVAWLPMPWHLLLLTAATPYLALYLALVPAGPIRAYNRVGDYSYGVYIYGVPVQLVLYATLTGSLGVFGNFMATAAVSLVLAALSWHLIERRALGWKGPRRFRRAAPDALADQAGAR